MRKATLERLNADLRAAIHEGMNSGPAIPAEDVFAELKDRYAKPGRKPAAKARGKRST